MRGRSGCPTGQEKHSVGATAGSPLFCFYKERLRTGSPPHPTRLRRATFPPRGRLWRLSFAKMLSSIFSLENASQIGLSIPEETAPLSYQRQRSPKRANESERAMNPGSRGLAPGPLSPHFSGEMGTPAGQAGPRGAAPQGRLRSCPPEGYAPPPAPPHTGVWLTRAATARAARTPEAPAWASPRVIPAPSPAAKKLGRAVSRSGESFSRAE